LKWLGSVLGQLIVAAPRAIFSQIFNLILGVNLILGKDCLAQGFTLRSLR
jgi:hypothetical protein